MDRPIQAAANAVRETAEQAKAMLAQLQAGWLWQILIRPITHKK